MSNSVRSVRALTAELTPMMPPRAVASAAEAPLVATPPKPIAVVGVHGISPIQQYAFQDQLATGLLAYLNARDDAGLGPNFERRCDTDRRTATLGPPDVERRSLPERRSGKDRRVQQAPPPPTGDRRRAKPRWAATPYWPRVARQTEQTVLKPSALRLHLRSERNQTEPATQVYDVFEGYWSPLSKGKTALVSALLWLLRVTFLATSSTARIPATWAKLFWDLGYVVVALTLVLGLFGGSALAGAKAWTNFLALFDIANSPTSFWKFASSPFTALDGLPRYAWAHLIIVVLLAYLFVQLVQLFWRRDQGRRRNAELLQDSGSGGHFRTETIKAAQFHRVLAIIFVVAFVALAVVDAVILVKNHPDDPAGVAWESLWLLVTVGMAQTGRWLADFVVENILGDVQIYTTHDCNSTFYAIRQQIITTVTDAVLGAVNAVDVTLDRDGTAIVTKDDKGDPVPLYRNIHIAGHSLGSTIAMDVLLRIRQLSYEGAVSEEAWSRVRSLTTLGTALEKTRFLLDVRNPTVSAAQQQWQNDAYGRFFTRDPGVLANDDNTCGIFWANHWYAHDVVANRIVSYKSVVEPGHMSFGWLHKSRDEHAICANNLIPHARPPWAFVHGDYLGDALFWNAAGPVLTS